MQLSVRKVEDNHYLLFYNISNYYFISSQFEYPTRCYIVRVILILHISRVGSTMEVAL